MIAFYFIRFRGKINRKLIKIVPPFAFGVFIAESPRIYVFLRHLRHFLSHPAFLRGRYCGPIDTRRCRSNRFPRRLVRYIPNAITGSAICHAATPADISEYPPVIMRLFVKFTRGDQSLEIESRYPTADKKNRGYFQRKRAEQIPSRCFRSVF